MKLFAIGLRHKRNSQFSSMNSIYAPCMLQARTLHSSLVPKNVGLTLIGAPAGKKITPSPLPSRELCNR